MAQGGPKLTDPQKKQLAQHMDQYLPGKKLEFLIPLGADPVAAELATKK